MATSTNSLMMGGLISLYQIPSLSTSSFNCSFTCQPFLPIPYVNFVGLLTQNFELARIFGMGESAEDTNSFLASLKELNLDGIPINFFIENPALPLKSSHNKESAIETIDSFNDSIIMLAGGREVVFGENWIEGIKAGANAIVIGDYLTAKGEKPDKDIEILKSFNSEIANER